MNINCETLGFSQQEYEKNKARLQRDLLDLEVTPFSWKAFEKTTTEREEVENAKSQWRAYMRIHGFTKRCGRINAV